MLILLIICGYIIVVVFLLRFFVVVEECDKDMKRSLREYYKKKQANDKENSDAEMFI